MCVLEGHLIPEFRFLRVREHVLRLADRMTASLFLFLKKIAHVKLLTEGAKQFRSA